MEKNTRMRLMEAAIDLFSIKGFAGTGVDEIAAHIGLKGPNLYKYFKGKDDLLNEIVKWTDEEYERGMKASWKAMETVQNGEQLKEATMRSIGFTLDHPMVRKMRRIFTIEQYRNEMFAECATRHQLTSLVELNERVFVRLMKEGKMVKGDAKVFALEFVAPTTLMIQLCDREPDRKEEAMKVIESHIDQFIGTYISE